MNEDLLLSTIWRILRCKEEYIQWVQLLRHLSSCTQWFWICDWVL
jgi:hypothetical protein